MDTGLMKTIIRCGIPEAASQLTTPVTSFCYNTVLSGMIGDIGISTFSVLSFIFSLANAILMGVAQGMQPLWGRCYGKNDVNGMKYYLNVSLLINTVLSVVITVLLSVFSSQAIMIFNTEPELIRSGSKSSSTICSFIYPYGSQSDFGRLLLLCSENIRSKSFIHEQGVLF